MKHYVYSVLSTSMVLLALVGGVSVQAIAQTGQPSRQVYQWIDPSNTRPGLVDSRTGSLIVKRVGAHDSVLTIETIPLNKAFIFSRDTVDHRDMKRLATWACTSAPESWMELVESGGDDGVVSVEVKKPTQADVTRCAHRGPVDRFGKDHPYKYSIFLIRAHL